MKNAPATAAELADLLKAGTGTRDDILEELSQSTSGNAMPAWAEDIHWGCDLLACLADGSVIAYGAEHVFGRSISGDLCTYRDIVAYRAEHDSTVILSAADIEESVDEQREGEIESLMARRHDAHGDGWDRDYAPDHRSPEY
ncbi:MAG: hypothetical protein K2X54_19170 [Methylobacterium organophilum]|nr:hypothetical protein [Methylobacterium organophilum]